MSSTAISPPRAVLICRPNSHPFQDRTVGLEQSIKIGRSVARSRPNLTNAIFDCKVLSRNHALLWYETGKFYLQDTKSSNGTFINNQRLSKSSEESPPREVSSGDIVQFGVDVMEVTKKVTHGCIVATLQLFLPDGKEAKASSSTMLADKGTTTSVQEIYQLNQFIQEALHREQLIETKLSNMSKLMSSTKDGVDTSWKALIEEDRLLTRVDILERQLEVSHKSMSEDKLRNEVVQLHDDKEKYQAIAKDILRKAVQEKMDSIVKYQELEMTLSNSQQEKVLLKELCESSAIELSDLAVKYEESQRKSKELVQELSESAEKYKDEVEGLNKKLKEGESLVEDRQKLIDSLVATNFSDKLKEALSTTGTVGGPESQSASDSSGESVTLEKEQQQQQQQQQQDYPPICKELDKDYNNIENSQKWFKYAIKVEELKDELKVVLREKLEVHQRICQLIELFDNLKAVSNKVQVSEYLVDLIAKVDTEIRQFKKFTQSSQEDLDKIGVYESENEKVEEGDDLDTVSRRISISPKTVAPTIGGEKLLDESRHAVNSLELQNGAVNSEIHDLTLKLTDSTKQLDIQLTAMSGENGELGRRLMMSEEQRIGMEHQLTQAMFQNTMKDRESADSEKTIQQLRDEVSALTEQMQMMERTTASTESLLHSPQLSPSSLDLKKDKSAQTTSDDQLPKLSTFDEDQAFNLESLSTKLMEAEEELAIYKEQFQQSTTECLRLERKLTEQAILAKESNMGAALRYVVPLMIFILAILIAFHPSS